MATPVIMPKFEMAQETGQITRWLEAEGAVVEQGQPLAETETDKATMEIEAPASGVLRGVCAEPGVTIPVGQTIAYIEIGRASCRERV